MLKLGEVRAAMERRNIPTLAMEVDQVAAARGIIGRTNATDPFLPNMIRALTLCPWLNTPADWQRLEAAIIVKAHRGARRVV